VFYFDVGLKPTSQWNAYKAAGLHAYKKKKVQKLEAFDPIRREQFANWFMNLPGNFESTLVSFLISPCMSDNLKKIKG